MVGWLLLTIKVKPSLSQAEFLLEHLGLLSRYLSFHTHVVRIQIGKGCRVEPLILLLRLLRLVVILVLRDIGLNQRLLASALNHSIRNTLLAI